MKKILCSLCAFFALVSVIRAGDESSSVATDYTFVDIENWAGPNWQAGGWTAVQLKKINLEKSLVQVGFDSVSPYNTGDGPNFLLRVQLDGRYVFLTNSASVVAKKPGAVLMRKKGGVFEAALPRDGALGEASIDYGMQTSHLAPGNLNAGNNNDPRFTVLRFIPVDADGTVAGDGGTGGAAGASAAGGAAGWEAFALSTPDYYGGPNWLSAAWPTAQGKVVGKKALIKIGFDNLSVYRGADQAGAQGFLCRLVFKSGETVFLTNSAEVARRKGGVTIMERKDGRFEAVVDGLGELKEVAVDFGQSTLAYGRGTWNLNEKNAADVRFDKLEISPASESSAPAAPAARAAPAAAQPASATRTPPGASGQETKGSFTAPNYYGGPNWVVAVFEGAKGLKLAGKDTALRLGFDDKSCYNAGNDVNFLLRVVFENGKTIYATNSAKIAAAMPGGKIATFALNKSERYFTGALAGAGARGVVREIAVDFGEETSHLPVPLNKKNENNVRFTQLTVQEEP